MSPAAQRILIAEACGWREAFPASGAPHPDTKRGGILLPYKWVNENTHERRGELPDYLADLNAMAEAEKLLTHSQQIAYARHLCHRHMSLLHQIWMPAVFATAAQRSEALLRTLSLWDDSK